MADDLTALLEPIRADLHAAGLVGLLDADPAGDFFPAALARHCSVLLAAIRAVLEKAGEWEREFARLEPSGADASGHANPGSYLVSGRLGALEDCTAGLREAITSSLSGDGAVKNSGEEGAGRG